MALSNKKSKIENFFPHKVTGKTDDSFVGLKIKGNEIHFFYPETYHFDVESTTLRKDIINLLRTISLAKTSSTDINHANNKKIINEDFALMSYLWIINDYLVNGFYTNREKVYKTNQTGRINWKRTMQLKPIVSKGNVIYPNLIVEIKNDVDNILVEIHKHCVKKSIDIIGWLFGITSSFIETKPFDKKRYIITLQKEMDKTFDDDKRLRLNHMLNVILGLDASDNENEFVYGVDSYYYIFEKMVDSIFGNVKNMRDFYPKANWQLARNNFKETPSSKLRPDTIIIKENDVFVVDSKFYRFGYTGKESDLPETTSIQKQITYGDFIKRNVTEINISNIYNAFIMPYDKRADLFNSDDDIQYVGFAKSTWKDNSENHEIIHAFLIDLKHVVYSWNKCNHNEDVDFLIAKIISNQNKYIKFTNTQ